jgi:uncharacterized protein YjiS (DUF1127 family)
MSATISTNRAFRSATATGPGRSIRAVVVALRERIVLMRRVAATRRDLGTLDRRLLSDIGAGRAEAAQEAERWPWDLEARRSGWPGGHRS